MAHKEQREYCEWVVKRHQYALEGLMEQYKFPCLTVLDVGSLDINGNNKYLFETHCKPLYMGLDLGKGPNVDVVSKAHEYSAPDGSFDVIISTEMLEHDMYWRETLQNALRMLRSGGLMILTCASGVREEHGTPKSGKLDSSPFTLEIPEWCDYYRNLYPPDLREVLDPPRNFKVCEIMQAGWAHKRDGLFYDLYFSGVKK